MINLVIPLGGKGERFINEGYLLPKPLIKVLENEIILWLLNNIDFAYVETVIIPYNDNLFYFDFENFIINKFPLIKFYFMRLEKQTCGACDTLYRLLSNLKNNFIENNNPFLCLDGDAFYTINITKLYSESTNKNSVFVFHDTTPKPIYSYIKPNKNEKSILEIKEKEKISDLACCGAYGFESYHTLLKYAKQCIDKQIIQKNEYYISGIYKCMLLDEIKVNYIEIKSSDFNCLGTPLQVQLFVENDVAAKKGSTNSKIENKIQ